jgi:hypothetical protein
VEVVTGICAALDEVLLPPDNALLVGRGARHYGEPKHRIGFVNLLG